MISADNHRANSNWLKLKLIWIWKPIGDNAVNLLKGTRPDKALPIHTHTLTHLHTHLRCDTLGIFSGWPQFRAANWNMAAALPAVSLLRRCGIHKDLERRMPLDGAAYHPPPLWRLSSLTISAGRLHWKLQSLAWISTSILKNPRKWVNWFVNNR